MADPQDVIVTNFTELVTTTANQLVADILQYHQPLAMILFELPGLDADHKAQLAAIDKVALRSLRQRIDSLAQTLIVAQQAGEI